VAEVRETGSQEDENNPVIKYKSDDLAVGI
jgi:hypothetical protein